MSDAGPRPLDGVRVVDLTRIVSGPTATFYLAALGAEVIRIEPPGGEITWSAAPFVGPDGVHTGPRGERDISLSPLRRHRGKRSVELDLRNPVACEMFASLLGASDVLVDNMRVGALADLGFDTARLEAINPALIHCSITGYGPDGPYRDRPAMDIAVQAVSGMMAKTGFPDGPPTKSGVTIADHLPGIFAALGVVAALRQRDRDPEGRGQTVDVAMLDAALAVLWDEPLDHYEDSGWDERYGNDDPRGAPLGCFRTEDGWVALVVGAERQWRKLTEQMDRHDLYERFPTVAERSPHRAEVNGAVTAWAAGLTSAAMLKHLEVAGVPASEVAPPWSARHDPHVAHRGALERLAHPDLAEPSTYLGARLPIRFSRASNDTEPAEPLGASTRAVLAELLGLTAEELGAAAADGAFG